MAPITYAIPMAFEKVREIGLYERLSLLREQRFGGYSCETWDEFPMVIRKRMTELLAEDIPTTPLAARMLGASIGRDDDLGVFYFRLMVKPFREKAAA
jgi:hypothetical protein